MEGKTLWKFPPIIDLPQPQQPKEIMLLDILDISRVRTSSHPAARLWMPNYWEYGIPM